MRSSFHDLGDEVSPLRTRSNQCHVPFDHIKELGQFIETGLAEEFADRGNPRIVLTAQLRTCLFRILHHGPELDDAEWLAVPTNALLQEKHRALAGSPHRESNSEQDRTQHDQRQNTHHPIHHALQRTLPLRHDLPINLNQRRPVNARHPNGTAEDIINVRNDSNLHRTAFHPIQDGLQNGVITRTNRDDHLLNAMVANDALKVGNLAEVGHQRLQLRIRTVGLDESDEVEPRILAEGLHFFNGAQRTLISSNHQGGEAPLTAVDLLDRSRRDDHPPEQRERTVTQEQHTQRGVILTVGHNRIVQ